MCGIATGVGELRFVAKFVVLKKGGGGKVAINPVQVAFVRSAAGAFTDVFFDGQQVAVEGSFDEIVKLLSLAEAPIRPAEAARNPFGQFERSSDGAETAS
jgi:hypothetical protein